MGRSSNTASLIATLAVLTSSGCELLSGLDESREIADRPGSGAGSSGGFDAASGGVGGGGTSGAGGAGGNSGFAGAAGVSGTSSDAADDADAASDASDAGSEEGTDGAVQPARASRVAVGGNPYIGNGYACAVLLDGGVKCWGSNLYGELGLGDVEHRGDEPGEMGEALPRVNLGTKIPVTSVATGGNHTCATLFGGAMKCWGFNDNAMLGLEDTAHRADGPGEMGDLLPFPNVGSLVRINAVSCSNAHTCVRLDTTQIKCWGGSGHGETGLGSKQTRGGRPGEMGDALPIVDLGAGSPEALVSQSAHNCAIIEGGKVKCWGANWLGQLGLGDTESRGDDPGEMGDNLPAVDLGPDRRATALALGYEHSCALLDNGQVKCWGGSTYGELGLGDTQSRGSEPGQMGLALSAVDLGDGEIAKLISSGGRTTCVLLESDRIKCWGQNGFGQLGLGDTNHRGDQPGEMGDDLPAVDVDPEHAVIDLSVGLVSVCAVLSTNRIRCWGSNEDGELGIGTRDHRGDAPGEMGVNLPLVDLGVE
jgi:alpha-tubulin suppressor-like RCC1 family protein